MALTQEQKIAELQAYYSGQASAPTAPTETPADGSGMSTEEKRAALQTYYAQQENGAGTEQERNSNTMLDDIAAFGQIAAESVSAGIIGDEQVARTRTFIDMLNPASYGEGTQSFLDTYDMYLEDARDREAEFRREHPVASIATDVVGGLGTGFGVAAKLGNAATRGMNIARQGGAAGAESGIHGYMEGETPEESAMNALKWGGIGTVVGGSFGGLMRGQNSIDELRAAREGLNKVDDASSLAGKEGFVSDSELKKKAGKVRRFIDVASKSLQDQAAELISPRFGALLNRSDGDRMRDIADTMHSVDEVGGGVEALDKFFKSDKGIDIALKIANSSARDVVTGDQMPAFIRARILDEAKEEIRRIDPRLADTFDKMYEVTGELSKRDIGNEATAGFFPRRGDSSKDTRSLAEQRAASKGDPVASSNIDSAMPVLTKESIKNYKSPVGAFMEYLEDVATADSMVKSFGLDITPPSAAKAGGEIEVPVRPMFDMDAKPHLDAPLPAKPETPLPRPDAKNPRSNITPIKAAIQKKLKDQGASKEHMKLANQILDAYAVSSRKGPATILQVMRTATSVALLGTPENAMLQLGDLGQAAYQSGFKNAIFSMPRAIKSMFTNNDKIVDTKGKMFRAPDLGITRQFLGELKREGETSFTKTLDWGGNKIMTGVGIRQANRLGQETAINAAYKRASAVASKDPSKLAELPATRGWTTSEIEQLGKELNSGEQTDLVKSYLFTTLTDIQPISPSALPEAYANHPNGRVLYSMKTYMVKQMNIMRTDVIGKMNKADKLGLGTKEGQKLFREASISAIKYATMVAGLNGVVDAYRKVPRKGEADYDVVDNTMGQLTSNMTAGFFDSRAAGQGRDPASGILPPAIKAPIQLTYGAYDAVWNQNPDALIKAFNLYTPAWRTTIWGRDVAEQFINGNN